MSYSRPSGSGDLGLRGERRDRQPARWGRGVPPHLAARTARTASANVIQLRTIASSCDVLLVRWGWSIVRQDGGRRLVLGRIGLISGRGSGSATPIAGAGTRRLGLLVRIDKLRIAHLGETAPIDAAAMLDGPFGPHADQGKEVARHESDVHAVGLGARVAARRASLRPSRYIDTSQPRSAVAYWK